MAQAKHLLSLILFIVALTFLATGCAKKGTPVLNPSSTMPVMEKVSDKHIQEAIIKAGAIKNWEIIPTGPNKLEGRYIIRSHTAVVEITYDKKKYAINYKNSINLNYKDGTIHRNYNIWVAALENEIRRQLASLNNR